MRPGSTQRTPRFSSGQPLTSPEAGDDRNEHLGRRYYDGATAQRSVRPSARRTLARAVDAILEKDEGLGRVLTCRDRGGANAAAGRRPPSAVFRYWSKPATRFRVSGMRP